MLCTVEFCGDKTRAKGLCSIHYMRQWHGNPLECETKVCFYEGCDIVLGRKNTAGLCKSHYKGKWAQDNPETKRQASLDWIKRNPEKHNENGMKWKRENPEKSRAIRRKAEAKRNATKREVFVEEVDYNVVFVRDNGICHLCSLVVDPEHWELDHIIPLSLLGPHCYRNVAVSHPSCNESKNNRFTSPNPLMDAAARQSFREFHGYELEGRASCPLLAM